MAHYVGHPLFRLGYHPRHLEFRKRYGRGLLRSLLGIVPVTAGMYLILTIFRYFCLRDIDHEVTHLLEFSDNVHVEHAHLIIVG